MSDTAHCPECGGSLVEEGWGEDLCPHCLLKMALEESSGEGLGDEDTTSALTVDTPLLLLTPGQILGNRYGIRKQLGRGGMGEVWRAFDLKLRVDVALKAVRLDLQSRDGMRETLHREVRAAREVASPNVCRVYDLEEIDGRELVSMELVQGSTLLETLRQRGPLELQEAREIASQLLAGLEAIHHAGLVHRDLKPENVMITPASRVVVMDFGVAKGFAEAKDGTVSGTPAYMAPEQGRGEAVDARADVFSAGVVLVEMLAPRGEDFREDRRELWRGVRQQPPSLPDSPWRPVLERAVAHQPERRFATASALARALEEVALRVEGAEDLDPYPGLVAFGENDREYFFGRELEVEALWKKIRRRHMLALIGPSGAGKTSFLRAGFLPSAPAGWSHVLLTPGGAPLTALRQALVPVLSGDSEAMRELVTVDNPDAMVSAVSSWRARSKRALLVVDQFEELFTLNPPEVQAGFAQLLGRLTVDADVRIMLSMRDDFLIRCHAYEALTPILSDMTLLGPPTGAALRRAVVQPALKCGYRFEDEKLVDEMLHEVQGERGALPMLAFSAEQLWQRRDREAGLLTREAYEVIGGVGGALAQHAELTLERIGSDRVPIVRELFRNLVTSQGTRAVRGRGELLSVFGGRERGVAADVLDALIDARLLTSYGVESSLGEGEAAQRVEIVHESLLSAWPRLVRWTAQDVEGARLRDDLRQASRRWQERDRPDDLLWTGSAYREYQVWRERYPGRLSELEEDFARATKDLATRRRRRRRVVVSSAFATLLLIAGVLGVMLRYSMLQSRRAEASKLLALGYIVLEEERTEALAYAIAALKHTDTPEGRRLALRALWAGPPATVVPESRGAAELAFSPDGRLLAVGYQGKASGQARLFPSDGSQPIELGGFEGKGSVWPMAFSPDGKRLVGGGLETPGIRIWETFGGQTERVLEVPDVDGAAGWFDLDGESVITVAGRSVFGGAATSDRTVEILVHRWPVVGGPAQLLGSVEGTVLPFAFPDLSRGLLPVGRGHSVELHRFENLGGEPGRVIARHPDAFGAHSHPAFDPSADRVAFWDKAGNLCVWPMDGDGTEPERCIETPGKTFSIAFSPDGAMLAQATYDKGAQVWDLRGPVGVPPLGFGREGGVTLRVVFSPDGRWLATARSVGLVLWPMTHRFCRVLRGHDGGVSGLAFARDGSRLFTQGRHDGSILSWDLSGGAGLDPSVVLQTERRWGWGLSADPHGRYLISATNVGVWMVPLDGSPPTQLDDGPVQLWGFDDIDPSGRLVAHQSYAEGHAATVVVNDVENGERWELDGPGGGDADHWAFDRMGRLMVARGGTLSRWDPATGATEILFEKDIGGAMPLSDDRLYVSGENRFVLDLEDGSRTVLPGAYQRARTGYPLLFDATGTVVATGVASTGEIRVGRLFDEQPHVLLGTADGFEKIRISPDGRWVAASGTDGAVRLWPVPDLSRHSVHTLPHDELMARLMSLTNLRVVPDKESPVGYEIKPDFTAYRGWADVPQW